MKKTIKMLMESNLQQENALGNLLAQLELDYQSISQAQDGADEIVPKLIIALLSAYNSFVLIDFKQEDVTNLMALVIDDPITLSQKSILSEDTIKQISSITLEHEDWTRLSFTPEEVARLIEFLKSHNAQNLVAKLRASKLDSYKKLNKKLIDVMQQIYNLNTQNDSNFFVSDIANKMINLESAMTWIKQESQTDQLEKTITKEVVKIIADALNDNNANPTIDRIMVLGYFLESMYPGEAIEQIGKHLAREYIDPDNQAGSALSLVVEQSSDNLPSLGDSVEIVSEYGDEDESNNESISEPTINRNKPVKIELNDKAKQLFSGLLESCADLKVQVTEANDKSGNSPNNQQYLQSMQQTYSTLHKGLFAFGAYFGEDFLDSLPFASTQELELHKANLSNYFSAQENQYKVLLAEKTIDKIAKQLDACEAYLANVINEAVAKLPNHGSQYMQASQFTHQVKLSNYDINQLASDLANQSGTIAETDDYAAHASTKLQAAATSYNAVTQLSKVIRDETIDPEVKLVKFKQTLNQSKIKQAFDTNPDSKVKNFFKKVGYYLANFFSAGLVHAITKGVPLMSTSQSFFHNTRRSLAEYEKQSSRPMPSTRAAM